jgi:hypothetical protein
MLSINRSQLQDKKMKYSNLYKIATTLLFAIFITSCSTIKAPEIIKTYEAKSFKKPVNSFLVIGVGKDKEANIKFEALLSDTLKNNGVEAHSAALNLDKGVKLSKESAIALTKRLGVEAVLVTRLLGSKLEIEKIEKRTEVKIERPQFEKLSEFFVYEYTQIQTEQDLDITATVVIATDLFTTADEGRVLSMESTSFDKNNAEVIIEETIREIVSQLKRDNIVR